MGKTKTPAPHDVGEDVAEMGMVDMTLVDKIIGMKLQQDRANVARSRKRPTDDNFILSGKKRVPRGPISNLKVVTVPTKKSAKGDEKNTKKSQFKLDKTTAEPHDEEEGLPEDEEVDDEEEDEEDDPGELPEKTGQMSDDPTVRSRQCDVCFRVFSAFEKLRRHLRSHTQVAEAKCSLCNQNIKYRYNLKNHMKMCQAKMRSDTETETLKVRYPNFLAGIRACMRDPTVPIPDLDEGTPFQVDKFGFVTGFDDTLEIDLDLLIPNYNPNKHLEVVADEDLESDEDYEGEGRERVGDFEAKCNAGGGIKEKEYGDDDDEDGEDDDEDDEDGEDGDDDDEADEADEADEVFENSGSSRDVSQ